MKIGKLKSYECNFIIEKYFNFLFVVSGFSFRFDIKHNTTLVEMLRNYHDSDVDGVAFSSKEAVIYFNVMEFPHRHLSFTNDQLLSGYNMHYFPKKSIFRDLFNFRIQAFHEAGLTDFWYMERMLVYHNRNMKESSQSALYFDNIIGVIEICATMYLISLITFLLEMMTLIFPQICNILDYFAY